MKPWCVEHRDGWCKALDQSARPADGSLSVYTECGMVVTLPLDIEARDPTCSTCRALARDETDPVYKLAVAARVSIDDAAKALKYAPRINATELSERADIPLGRAWRICRVRTANNTRS